MPAASASSSMAAASSARGGDADDLDDGLDYQPTLAGGVPEDDDDDAEDVDVGAPSDDEEGAPAWDADDGDPDRSDVAVRPSLALRSSSQGKKRKEADDEGKETTGDMSLDTGSNDDEDARKKKKMKQKERKQAKVAASDCSSSKSPGEMSIEELDAWMVDNLRKTFKAASDMEVDDLKIPTENLKSTSDFERPRVLANLPVFIREQMPPLAKNLRKPGTPSIIILCLSGMRCADVIRTLKSGMGEPKPPGEVGKLFAKHFKVQEQVEWLKANKAWVCVGTPGRIAKLLADSDALQIRHNTHFILDLTFEDPKKRTLLTINEIRDEFWRAIFQDKTVRAKVLQSPDVKIAVF